MIRGVLLAGLVAIAMPLVAAAQQHPAYQMHLSGPIMIVDYTDAIIFVHTRSGPRRIVITPSTEIDVPGKEYATINDLRSGGFVEVSASVVHGAIVAQFVRLRR